MTPELREDIRCIATFAAERQLDPEYTYDEDIWQGGHRVLAWLDAQEQEPDLTQVCDAVADEPDELDFILGIAGWY